MASRLSLGLYLLRLDMNTPLAHYASFLKRPQERGRARLALIW